MIEKEIGRFFDCCETEGQRKLNGKLSRKARRALVSAIREQGLEGKTVLEIGSGPGDLTRELLRLGAARATGFDLAEKTIEEARRNAVKEGLADRVEYRLGNGAKEQLPSHDVVVLDKVICCYPDWEGLVDNTSGAAGVMYGFVIPRSDGLLSLLVRAVIGVGNFANRMKKCGFRAFVHDYRAIDARIREKGYKRTHYSHGPIWMTAVYARP